MKYETMGKLIQSLRKEKGLTQKQLADMLSITDKAVSKWERDIACPDTATLPKLAEILGISVEALLNAKVETAESDSPDASASAGVPEEDNDINLSREHHQAELKKLLLKGIPGFVVGFLLMIIAYVSMGKQNGIFDPATLPFVLVAAVVAGIWFAGFPFGYSLLTNALGRWTVGSAFISCVLFFIKCTFALWIGAIVYPVAIIYHIIKAQRTNRRVKRAMVLAVVLCVSSVLFGIGAIIVDTVNHKGPEEPDVEPSESVATIAVDVSVVNGHLEEIDLFSQHALEITQQQEQSSVNMGWDVGEPSQVCCVYFLTAKDVKNPAYVILEKLDVYNAIVVISGYYVRSATIPINAWEFDVHIYPNLYLDPNNTLCYETSNYYALSTRKNTLEEVVQWLRGEYNEMEFVEITSPQQ